MPQTTSLSASRNSSSAKKDLILAFIVGVICAVLMPFIWKNLPLAKYNPYYVATIFPFLCLLGMAVSLWLAKKIRVFYQIAKFVLVGGMNTFIDWGILNLFMNLTGAVEGAQFSVFKGVSFIVATTSSFFWNKWWTFNKKDIDSVVKVKEVNKKETAQFFIVSLIGFGLNVGMASIIVNVVGPQFGLPAKTWANVGAFGGTLIGLGWNFIGYKMMVFKS